LAQCQAYASYGQDEAINPKITEMRERLKDKPQEMQQAMMKIYRTKGQPDGWLFPDLIQIPVFIALYWVLLSSGCATRPGFWIKDLLCTRPILSCRRVLHHHAANGAESSSARPCAAKLMWFHASNFFDVMFSSSRAGLVLYWIDNILSIAQQWAISPDGCSAIFNLPRNSNNLNFFTSSRWYHYQRLYLF
jgi:YidC/Oxa1 family membrane protein insertase